ncbi:threonine aldolase family protein [Flavobacterium sp.]|uniref:threonine aldolase family protein n=1 Tax=Flavobacterium sp. TaxID=239 RepID=UPI004047A50B
MEINLISDTVTKPTPAMLDVMFKAEVGDDVFKQDPTVNELERYTAKLFGKEAALFFPSGTMANQTAIKLHTQPADEVICDKWSHIFLYEGGGVAANSGVSCHLVDGDRGKITAQQVRNVINDPEFYHAPTTRLVSIENTTNKGGGACYELEELEKIKRVCQEHNLKFHLDGARLWNAMVAKNQQPRDFGNLFDTISVCLSKGLGAPVGSVLVGSAADIKKAIRIRKLFGGNMRQAGYLAAAGLYAIKNNVERLAHDHQRAKELGEVLVGKKWIASVAPVETNIVIFTLQQNIDEKMFVEKLKQKSILITSMGQGKLRMVTHLDYRGVMHDFVIDVLKRMEF